MLPRRRSTPTPTDPVDSHAMQASKLQPALLGGVFIGVLSALPIVSAGNLCCCLWVLSGGALAAYLLQQNQPVPADHGRWGDRGAARRPRRRRRRHAAVDPDHVRSSVRCRRSSWQRILDNPDVPPEMRQMLENVGAAGGFSVHLAHLLAVLLAGDRRNLRRSWRDARRTVLQEEPAADRAAPDAAIGFPAAVQSAAGTVKDATPFRASRGARSLTLARGACSLSLARETARFARREFGCIPAYVGPSFSSGFRRGAKAELSARSAAFVRATRARPSALLRSDAPSR